MSSNKSLKTRSLLGNENDGADKRHETDNSENDVDSDQIITGIPTAKPTNSPTSKPSLNPTKGPTVFPTTSPTTSPTLNPTANPTNSPTSNPTSSPTSNPTASPTPVPLCYPDKNGNYGVVKGRKVSEQILNFKYEIESKPSTNGAFLVEKVENEISAKILGEFFESCASFSGLRRLDDENVVLSGFSSKPEDVMDENGCRVETPANGNSCTSINGSLTMFGTEESMDPDKAKIKALESIMDAMSNDEFIHVDESIVKINFVPKMEQQQVAKDPVVNANSSSSGGSDFNMGLMAFIPFGVVCLAVLLLVIRKKKSRDFENLSNDKYDEHDLSEHQMNWKDAKLDQTSSIADSVHSEFIPYVKSSDTCSDVSSKIDPEITFRRTETSNGFEMNLFTPGRL